MNESSKRGQDSANGGPARPASWEMKQADEFAVTFWKLI